MERTVRLKDGAVRVSCGRGSLRVRERMIVYNECSKRESVAYWS